jgi:hypothetical protein
VSATATASTFTNRGRRGTTFKDGQREPIYRWFTITPSYAPALVADCAAHLGLGAGDHLLDPFAGAGTTAVWSRLAARPCTSVEWNPALAFVTRVKATLALPAADLAAAGARFAAAWRDELPHPDAAAAYLQTHRGYVPGIASPERWWHAPALAALTAARRLLALGVVAGPARPGVELALLRLLLPVSRARYSHASVTFDPAAPATPPAAIIAAFEARIAEMADDLAALADRPQIPGEVVEGNALDLPAVAPEPGRYTRVICSPPYPNRYSYARETRPHLFFLGLVDGGRAVGDLECAALGGTWGRATSLLHQPHEPEPTVVEPLMRSRLPALRDAHPLMANYGVRYVNDLWRHVQGLSRVMAPRARLAYVVGNSKLGGVETPTADWLLGLFAAAGWRPIGDGIHPMRRRNSRPGLVESVVFVER